MCWALATGLASLRSLLTGLQVCNVLHSLSKTYNASELGTCRINQNTTWLPGSLKSFIQRELLLGRFTLTRSKLGFVLICRLILGFTKSIIGRCFLSSIILLNVLDRLLSKRLFKTIFFFGEGVAEGEKILICTYQFKNNFFVKSWNEIRGVTSL